MTEIKEIKTDGDLVGFCLKGHAGYAPKDDIVCAGLTVITINTINSLVEIAHAEVDHQIKAGYSRYEIRGKPSETVNTLLQSAKLGYQSMAERYMNYVFYADELERR